MDLPYVAYADTACAKSVVGQDNAEALIRCCRDQAWPYARVSDEEPFRFGPGKRIWSTEALVVPVIWAQQTVLLRFSIVQANVPFLVSKFVFKKLGGVIDLESNELRLKRVGTGIETLYDLQSGHVAVELVKPGIRPPTVTEEAMEICKDGEEVTVDDHEI